MSLGSLIDAIRLAGDLGPAIRSYIRKTSGRKEALLLELETNVDLARNCFKDDLPLAKVIRRLKTTKLEQAVDDGYNFDRYIGGGKAKPETVGGARQLQPYVGATTGQLFRQVLRKIQELQNLVEIDSENPRIRKSVRLSYLLKLMLLLLRHVTR